MCYSYGYVVGQFEFFRFEVNEEDLDPNDLFALEVNEEDLDPNDLFALNEENENDELEEGNENENDENEDMWEAGIEEDELFEIETDVAFPPSQSPPPTETDLDSDYPPRLPPLPARVPWSMVSRLTSRMIHLHSRSLRTRILCHLWRSMCLRLGMGNCKW